MIFKKKVSLYFKISLSIRALLIALDFKYNFNAFMVIYALVSLVVVLVLLIRFDRTWSKYFF